MNEVEVKRGKTHAFRFSPDWLRKEHEILSELKSVAMNNFTNRKTDSSSDRLDPPFQTRSSCFVEKLRVVVSPARKCHHCAAYFHAR